MNYNLHCQSGLNCVKRSFVVLIVSCERTAAGTAVFEEAQWESASDDGGDASVGSDTQSL